MTQEEQEDLLADGLMTVKEAAKFLSITPQCLYNMISDGEICSTKFRGCRRVPRRALMEFVTKNLEGVS